MAQYIEVKDVEKLIKHAIEDSWELDYTLEKLKEINKSDVIERPKIDEAIKEMESIELVMFCDEMRDYCVDILKRHLEE